MKVFEIHITGDKSILKNAPLLSLHTIAVDLLKPDHSVYRTEYMTSDVFKCKDFDECLAFARRLVNGLETLGTRVFRAKIESPYYPQYAIHSLYIESHFETTNDRFPLSRNQSKDFNLATHREYRRNRYEDFLTAYDGEIIELCLYDTFVEEDADWFSMYSHDINT